MHQLKNIRPYIIFIFLIFLLIGCSHHESAIGTIEKLNIGFIPSEEAERMANRLEPLADFLSKELGIPVKIYRGNDYTAIIEGMKGRKVDIAVFGAFSYVLASEKANAEPLVVAGRDGLPASYKSCFITHKNSGINSMDEVWKNPGKFTLSFSDPASTSGHLVPKGTLFSWDIHPQHHFTDILFSGSHTATILAVATQKIAVAGCSVTVLNKMLERGMISEEDIKVLWISNPLPVDLFTVRKDLPEELKKQLEILFVRMKEEVPGIDEYFYDEWNDSTLRFIPVQDSSYQEIRNLAKYVREDFN